MGNWMVSLVNAHTNAIRIGWHLWDIDLRFAPGLPPGWMRLNAPGVRVPQGWVGRRRQISPHQFRVGTGGGTVAGRRWFFFFTLVTGPRRSLSLKLSDTRVYGDGSTSKDPSTRRT